MRQEMERDENVLLLGEDIGVYGGTQLVTDGLIDIFGSKRVVDTPIAENGFTGAAMGMAMTGLRPVVEMMTWNFSFLAADAIIQHAAKVRYFSGGHDDVTLVSYGRQVNLCMRVADKLEEEDDISAEVIDLRSLRPFDEETIIESVKKTHRAVAVQEQWRWVGGAREGAAIIQDKAFDYLDAPGKRGSGGEGPAPYARNLELA